MTKITIETETITTDLTPSEAAAKIKEALGIAEWLQIGKWYWFVDSRGKDMQTEWHNTPADHYRLAHGNCSPTQEGLAQYKADEAKKAAIVAIRKHRDKTFGVFEPDWEAKNQMKVFGHFDHVAGAWGYINRWKDQLCGVFVPFATEDDIERSFAECGEHWEVLK